jgi:hypothetical protein
VNPADPHAFFGVDRRGFAVEPGETVEIDSRRDLFIADAILREAIERQEIEREEARLRRAS